MTTYDLYKERSPWKSVLSTQLRVVAALVRREMRAHFGESRMGYLWALVEPALHLAVLMVLFTYILHRHPRLGTSTPLFILTGVIPYFLYSKMATYISGAIASNRALLTLPPVKPHDVILARTILESSTYMFVGFLMFFALFVRGVPQAAPNDPLAVLQACSLAITIGVGVGMINIVIVSLFQNWMTFFGFLSTPLWFFSGLWYLPDHVPEPFRGYMLYNPLVHVIMLFRMGFYREFNAHLLDTRYVIAFAAIVFALGLAAMRVARRQVLASP